MEAAAPVLVEAYKVGGIAFALLVVIGFIVWLVWKDSRARERRLSSAIQGCQDERAIAAKAQGEALANSTNALNNNTKVMETLCDVMRDRPCLKEPTPAKGTQLPRIGLLLAAALLLQGCTVLSTREERALANSQATMWEAAEAIRTGKDAGGPVLVIQQNASSCAAALSHPYPPVKETP